MFSLGYLPFYLFCTEPDHMELLLWSRSGLRLLTACPSKWAHLANTVGSQQWEKSPAQTNSPTLLLQLSGLQPLMGCTASGWSVRTLLITLPHSGPFRATLGRCLPWHLIHYQLYWITSTILGNSFLPHPNHLSFLNAEQR